MEENRNINHKNRQDDDQLRENTTNETIREVSGNSDLSQSNRNAQSGSNRGTSDEDLQGSDLTQGMSYNPNDASGVRSGGTTDMDDQTAGGAGLNIGERGSSHITTKQGVTGSDFDGQNATS